MFNIFVLAGFSVGLGLLLAMLVTRSPTPEPIQFIPPEDAEKEDDKSRPELTLADLERLGAHMCEANQLKIKDRLVQSENEVIWVAESTNPFFYGNYVLSFFVASPRHPYTTMTDILELKDFVKSVTSTKGFFFTTGFFTKDVYQPLEGPKVTLFNRPKILAELAKLSA